MNTSTIPKVHVRFAIRADLPHILAIEAASFEIPWTEDEFLALQKDVRCIGLVAEVNGYVVGYLFYKLYKKHTHLLNLAVHRGYRREGVAQSLINWPRNRLRIQKRFSLTARVRESNLPAQLFLRSQHFRCVSISKNYFEGENEDAYCFIYRLTGETCNTKT